MYKEALPHTVYDFWISLYMRIIFFSLLTVYSTVYVPSYFFGGTKIFTFDKLEKSDTAKDVPI